MMSFYLSLFLVGNGFLESVWRVKQIADGDSGGAHPTRTVARFSTWICNERVNPMSEQAGEALIRAVRYVKQRCGLFSVMSK